MILFEKTFPTTLADLAGHPSARTVETWTFDDRAARRAAEAAFAARGITARCRSAYKPLVTAFRDEIDTDGLLRAEITYPRHPDAGARRFLLESYPLAALFPATEFRFIEGAESTDQPGYGLRLRYSDGRELELTVPAPNRVHRDYGGNTVLSPCGWLVADGQGGPLETDYEQLFHQTMTALDAAEWDREPFFQELNIAVTLPARDEALGHGDEVLSLSEALHEDFYFSALELFGRKAGRPAGYRNLQPGQIVPEIRQGQVPSVRVEVRPYDAISVSDHMQDLDTAARALSQAQIAQELAALGGETYTARSVAGREIAATFHKGSDRGVIISAGQHANETTAPVGTLRAARRLLARKGVHFAICPLENPDGYALHQRLIRDNLRHMHHAARYTALGDDLEYRTEAGLFEKDIRLAAESRIDALLHLNFHGYPAHEWTRPLSGYIPRGFEAWTIPKGFFLVMRHAAGWDGAARRLMEDVTERLDAVPGLREFNDAQIALFEQHAGGTGFEILNGFPVMISEDDRHRVPMTLITEYPDETIYGDAFRAGHEAQMATVIAAYEALQDSVARSVPRTRRDGGGMNAIDLNSDLGESFGPWPMGDDAAMLDIVTSANIACGFHAGDPAGILRSLKAAAERGVTVGAHIGYRDLVGFGRRNMEPTDAELTADSIYQIGALAGLARAAGTRVAYVKPHGALYNTIAQDARQAAAVIAAIKAVDASLPLMALAGAPVVAQARAAGLRVICEAFGDRAYTADGQLVSRNLPGAVIHDPAAIAARMLRLVREGRLTAIDGTEIALEAQSICVHGDTPAAVAIAQRLRADLAADGIELTAFWA